jgi:GAF domain-containing protein
MTPDLETLADLVSVLDRWEQAGTPPEHMPADTLRVIQQALPEVTALRLFRLDGDRLLPVATTEPDTSAELLPFDSRPHYRQAQNTSEPTRADDATGWAVILRRREGVAGLLEVVTDPEQPATEGAAPWLKLAGAHFAAALPAETGDFAHLRVQVQRLQTINELAVQLTTIQDEQRLLDQTCRSLYDALQPDHVGVTMVDLDDITATVVSEYPASGAVGIKIEAHGGLQDRLRSAREPVLVNDVNNDPNLAEMSRQALQSIGIQSVLLLPLFDEHDAYIGAIGMDIYEAGRPFTSDMIDTARTITAQVEVTLQSLRLLHDIRRQARQTEQLTQLGQVLQTAFDPEDVLRLTMSHITAIFDAEHASILFYNMAQNRFRVVARRDGETLQLNITDGPLIEALDTTAAHIWETREALLIADLEKQPELRHDFREDIRSLLGQPIFSRGAALGVFQIGSTQPYSYQQADNTILQQTTSLMSAAVENAETYTQGQRLARAKALSNDISSQLQRQLEIDQIMSVTIKELGQALGARRGRIRLATDGVVESSRTE